MTQEEFERLVRRLESEARERPRRYRVRVVGLAALGYAYVGAVMIAALGSLGGMLVALLWSGRSALVFNVGIKAVWAVGGLVVVVARALWVRIPPPGGIALSRRETPLLFETIEAVRRSLRAPHPHVVLLTDDFNAGVVQRPRLGVLGWPRNYLCIGLPLLQSLSVDQFRAVLAHEFGHLSGAHGRLGGWIYRARTSWALLLEQMQRSEHWASFAFLPFFRWYAPYFNAYSFVQARAQEHEADRDGAAIAGAGALAQALIALQVRGTFFARTYWERIRARTALAPQPDVTPFASLGPQTFAEIEPGDAQRWLEEALAAPTTLLDTHPCLRERLAAISEPARLSPAPAESAAELLLGPQLAVLAGTLDARWHAAVAPAWRDAFQELQQKRTRLAELESVPETQAQTAELWERARLTEDVHGERAAAPLYQRVIEREPEHAGARFALGRLLLAHGEEQGLEHIERAIRATHEAILPGTEHAVAFLRRAGREPEAQSWIARAREHHAKLEAARAERARVRLDGRYDAHGLGELELQRVTEALLARPAIHRAWILRRRVDHFPESPMFVVGVRRRGRWYEALRRSVRQRLDLELQRQLVDLPLPGVCFILCVNHRRRRVRRMFESVPGARLL